MGVKFACTVVVQAAGEADISADHVSIIVKAEEMKILPVIMTVGSEEMSDADRAGLQAVMIHNVLNMSATKAKVPGMEHEPLLSITSPPKGEAN